MWILPVIYVLIQSPSGDTVRSYEGQSQETVQALLVSEGKNTEFLSEKDYLDFIENNKRPDEIIDPSIEQAKIDLNNRSKTDAERINAIIKYFGLDH